MRNLAAALLLLSLLVCGCDKVHDMASKDNTPDAHALNRDKPVQDGMGKGATETASEDGEGTGNGRSVEDQSNADRRKKAAASLGIGGGK
ncbi:MAG: hypothetical protein JSS72_10125 [Armatimonadetes bacterium]|nr:hypothetical protein [Armatimonadota bacterium]